MNGVRSQIGKTILDEGFSSYSTSYGMAQTFARSHTKRGSEEFAVVIETTFPKGKKLVPTSSNGYGAVGEREIIPKSGQKLKVTSYDVNTDRRVILLKTEPFN